jgi:predicted phosphodiesterase
MYAAANPEHTKEVKAARVAKKGPQCGVYAQMISDAYQPIDIATNNVCIISDVHVPFYDNNLMERLLKVPEEQGTTDLIIAGDMFDCDSYSKFSHLTAPACFESELEEVKKVLKRILRVFQNVYICRGNHEKRFLDLNAGQLTMQKMFGLARPSNMSEDEWDLRVHITTDDHITFTQNGEKWLCCHPRNYRIINLSVARDLAARFECSVIVAHGHQFCQGYDRSGKHRIMDGGGLFDKEALAYLRDTTCYPETRSGFYVLNDGKVICYEGK